MSFSDVIVSVALFALVLSPLGVGWIVVTLSERRVRRKRAEPTALEMYAVMRRRKNDAVRQMRAVVRDHNNPGSRQRRREWPS